MTDLDTLVWTAQGDAWQAEGRLRVRFGGGVEELPGIRLMSSGLPHAQWNSGDVTDPVRVPMPAVRAWFAARAHGAGVPWGIRVPAGMPFPDGRRLLRKRCMALRDGEFVPARAVHALWIGTASPGDVDTVCRIDAAAFGDPADVNRPWIAPRLDADGFAVALALLDGEPVATATAIRTDDRAGPCVGVFGVAVLPHARRRGIGAAVTSWLLERAFADGARLAHLNPDTDEAARLYGRLGFIETTGLDIYVGV
jgi:GNAT superfamily N-acetyltransferase